MGWLTLLRVAVLISTLASFASVNVASASLWGKRYGPIVDLYMDEENPTTNYNLTPWIYVQGSADAERAMLMVFSPSALPVGVVFDSAHVTVRPVGSSLSDLPVITHRLLRSAKSGSTWNSYGGGAWQVPGAWGWSDVDLDNPLGTYVLRAGLPPDSIFIARGETFSAYVLGRLGVDNVRLVWHADPSDQNGILSCDAVGGDGVAPRLILFGHRTDGRRRAIAIEGDGAR